MKTLNATEFHTELEKALEDSEKEVCSIKLAAEDDGTYDIRIWDERENESREDLEEGHFPSFEIANKRLNDLTQENQAIVFLRMEDEM